MNVSESLMRLRQMRPSKLADTMVWVNGTELLVEFRYGLTASSGKAMTPRPRSRGDIHPNRFSSVWNVTTPMRSNNHPLLVGEP